MIAPAQLQVSVATAVAILIWANRALCHGNRRRRAMEDVSELEWYELFYALV